MPAGVVTVLRTSPVAVLDSLTSTPETTAPVASVTRPVSWPAPPCAKAPTLRDSTTNASSKRVHVLRNADSIRFLLFNSGYWNTGNSVMLIAQGGPDFSTQPQGKFSTG